MKEIIARLRAERENLEKITATLKQINADISMLQSRLAEINEERRQAFLRLNSAMEDFQRELKPEDYSNVISLFSPKQ